MIQIRPDVLTEFLLGMVLLGLAAISIVAAKYNPEQTGVNSITPEESLRLQLVRRFVLGGMIPATLIILALGSF